jgi:amidophosphoribosyltransferase
MKIAAPPTVSPCFYGVDTPRKSELIANTMSKDEICEYIGANSLEYLSERGLYEGVQGAASEFCAACFNREYPTELYGLAKD